jgi:hypothetical protein
MSRSSMRRLKVLKALLAGTIVLSVGLVGAPLAQASSSQVISDCNSTGHLSGGYSRADLQGALSGMGADTKEYTNCYDVVRRALLSTAASGGHSGGGGGSSASGGGPSAGTQGPGGSAAGATGKAGVSTRGIYSTVPGATAAGHGSGAGVKLGDSSISPGATGINASTSSRSLPAPLIAVLALLGLAALSGGGIALRRRVVTRHGG